MILQCGCFAPFCELEILFHKTSVRLNAVFYNLGPLMILEPSPDSLIKSINQKLNFEISLNVTQFAYYKIFAMLKNY